MHDHDPHDLDAVKQSRLYKVFYPLMAPLLHSRLVAWSFLLGMVLLTVGAMGLAAMRSVPLKMLPFDNKNELLLVLDFDEGTTLERSDAAVREFEAYLAGVPEVADYTSYVGPGLADGLQRPGAALLSAPGRQRGRGADQPGRQEEPRSCRATPSACGCANDLQAIADRHHARMKLVETPPGPAGDRQRGGRGLRPAGPPLRGPAAGGRHGAGPAGGRAGRGRRGRRARGAAAEADLRRPTRRRPP